MLKIYLDLISEIVIIILLILLNYTTNIEIISTLN